MKRLKLYFDTSVLNFAFADDSPNEKGVTLKLLEEVKNGRYDVYISEVVITEIMAAPEEKAGQLISVVNDIKASELEFDEECRELAIHYIEAGVIPQKYEDDAFHIAIATVNNMDAIISWNFKHIVKLKTKKEVAGINLLMGYKEIEIYSPLEVVNND